MSVIGSTAVISRRHVGARARETDSWHSYVAVARIAAGSTGMLGPWAGSGQALRWESLALPRIPLRQDDRLWKQVAPGGLAPIRSAKNAERMGHPAFYMRFGVAVGGVGHP
jgi:hypothetical protein